MIVILFSASYAYYTSYNSANTTYNLTVEPELEITYLMTAGSTLNFTINPALLGSGGNSYVESSVATDTVMLDNASSVSSITCTYNIWYIPTTIYKNSATNTTGAKEFVLIGSDSTGQNTSFEYDLSKATTGGSIYSGKITDTNSSGAVTQTWTFTLRHYNLSVNQNEQMGKSYGGTITFKPTGCS